MAAPKTVKTYDLNGTLKDFPITFEYLARKFIVVTLIGTDRRELVLNTDYRFSTPTQITTLRSTGWGPADGYDLIEIRRVTSATDRLVDFTDGSILRAFDLNTSQVQSLHIAEEARDLTADTIGVDNNGNLDARARRIVNVADPVSDGDAVTLRYEINWAASTLNNKIASENASTASEASRQASLTQANASAASATASQASRVASEAARDSSLTYSNNASASSTLASKWASELEDIVVSGGKFSAYHWSLKAAAQAVIATTQANNAAASYDSFDDRYLGAKSSNPTVDNDGNTLLTGALYWNTTSNEMRVWNGSAWVTAYNSGGVTSFKTRVGAVVPASGDYTAAQITRGASTVDADITTLESANQKQYASWRIGTGHFDPAAGVYIHWSDNIVSKGITYDGIGTREFNIPVAGTYRIFLECLAGSANTTVIMRTRPTAGGALTDRHSGFSATDRCTLVSSCTLALPAGAKVSFYVSGGVVYNPSPGVLYNHLLIERIDS